MKKISYIFICLIASFALIFGCVKTVHADQLVNDRYKIEYDYVMGYQTFIVYSVDAPAIDDTTNIYPSFQVFEYINDTYTGMFTDLISIKRDGIDSYNVYSFNGSNLNKVIYDYSYIGVYAYVYANHLNIKVFDLRIGENGNYYIYDTIYDYTYSGTISSGLTYKFYTYGLSYGKVYLTINSPLNNNEATYIFNSWLHYPVDDAVTDAFMRGLTQGRSEGYTLGYTDGEETITAMDKVWGLLSGIFDTIGSVLSIQLIPHVPLGVFVLIPLFFGGLGLILWIWKGKN